MFARVKFDRVHAGRAGVEENFECKTAPWYRSRAQTRIGSIILVIGPSVITAFLRPVRISERSQVRPPIAKPLAPAKR